MNLGMRGVLIGILWSICWGNAFAETIPLDCRVDAFAALKGAEGRWTALTGEAHKMERFVLVLENGLISKESLAKIENHDTQPVESVNCAKSKNQHLFCHDGFHGVTIEFFEETLLGVIAKYGDGVEGKYGQVISLRPFSCTRE